MSKKRPKVLVVEDDSGLAQLYCTTLAMRGVATMRAPDGYAALRSVEHYAPDLVLLDLMMPNVDGWAVLREMTANPFTSNIPVIVITGVDPTPALPHAVMVIRKPCDPEYVARVVSDHLLATN